MRRVDLREIGPEEIIDFLKNSNPSLADERCEQISFESKEDRITLTTTIRNTTFKLVGTRETAKLSTTSRKMTGIEKDLEYDWQAFLFKKYGVAYSSYFGNIMQLRNYMKV